MTVKELIALLSAKNPNAHVMVWTHSEDAGLPSRVKESKWGDFRGRPYVKGDWPDLGWRCELNGQDIVIIC